MFESTALILKEIHVRVLVRGEEARFRQLLQAHHYLGALPKIGETLWYVATWEAEWVALLCFSAAAWKCAVRDQWIGWDFRHQYERLKLVANNSRFLILPDRHSPNLASRILSLCEKRLPSDWLAAFGHPLLLIETFVDPQRFRGTIYQAANWLYLGQTRGYRRTRQGYSATSQSPKKIFVRALQADARALLCRPLLNFPYRTGLRRHYTVADRKDGRETVMRGGLLEMMSSMRSRNASERIRHRSSVGRDPVSIMGMEFGRVGCVVFG